MILASYKYRLYPNKTQRALLSCCFGCARFIWNKNVEVFNVQGIFKSSTEYRNEFPFLQDVSAALLQQKEIDFRDFKKQFFSKKRKKRLGMPKFKKKQGRQSFRLPNQKFKVSGNRIRLEKIGWIRMVVDRPFCGQMQSVTVSRDTCGSYYASILVKEDKEQLNKTGCNVGLDLGLNFLITTSDGLQVRNLSDNQRKISYLQKRFSRKKKESNRRKKLELRIARLYRKQKRRRDWFLHNLSRYLVENYDFIVIEDLNVTGMLKNHKLARSISNASWSELIRQLEYKCLWYGKELHKIDRFYPSSKTCSSCGLVKENLTLADRVYKCCKCGLSLDRDLNASYNIKAVGVNAAKQSVKACKTCFKGSSLKQAIPVDLISFL